MQLLVALGRGDLLPRRCRQHGQGVMPKESEEAAGAREEGCKQGQGGSRGGGLGALVLSRGALQSPRGNWLIPLG